MVCTGLKEDVTDQLAPLLHQARAEGFKAGQEAMREQAATECEGTESFEGSRACAPRIRALAIEEQPAS